MCRKNSTIQEIANKTFLLDQEEREMSRINNMETVLKNQYAIGYQDGIKQGVKLMEERLLFACENGNPIEVKDRAYFIKDDIQNLREIFKDLESEV